MISDEIHESMPLMQKIKLRIIRYQGKVDIEDDFIEEWDDVDECISQCPWIYIWKLLKHSLVFLDEEYTSMEQLPVSTRSNLRFAERLINYNPMYVEVIPRATLNQHPTLLLHAESGTDDDDKFLSFLDDDTIRNNLNVVEHVLRLNGSNLQWIPVDIQFAHPELVILAVKKGGIAHVKNTSILSKELIYESELPYDLTSIKEEFKTNDFYVAYLLQYLNTPMNVFSEREREREIWRKIPEIILKENPEIAVKVLKTMPQSIHSMPDYLIETYPQLEGAAQYYEMRSLG